MIQTVSQVSTIQTQYAGGHPYQCRQHNSLESCVMAQSKSKRRKLAKSPTSDLKRSSRPAIIAIHATDKPSDQTTPSTTTTTTTTLNARGMSQQTSEANSLLSQQFASMGDNAAYNERRETLLEDERAQSWDHLARASASMTELEAQDIVLRIREDERVNLFGNVAGEAVPDAQSRDMGGRFLVNKPKIDQSKIYRVSQEVPKGAHLHIHFNSELSPTVLLPHARRPEVQDTMFVRTSLPLNSKPNLDKAEVVFNVMPKDTPRANCFADDYNPEFRNTTNSPWMLWAHFRRAFPDVLQRCGGAAQLPRDDDLDPAESWAHDKMVITVEQGYNENQTHNGAWACFNQGTRAFKGLLNYEYVYRWYIGKAIDSMIRDKVMYAEMRPMLMDKGIPSNDGTRQLSHAEQMHIVCEETKKKQEELKAKAQAEGKDAQIGLDQFPFGFKIIYSTPRSIPRERMQIELQDCLKLKLQFPDLVCGFDLVGAEDRPNHIGYYADLLVAFTETCKKVGVHIPFMFHAGETLLDTGGSSNPDNSNLYDSLLLNCKRIGHGYALLKHPLLIEKYKEKNICLELCPISNELLHLSGNAREHPYPALLAAGLHCSLNADNPSLFRGSTTFSSSLSHEFYQVMVGDPRMTIHGWKQLGEWSIEHSCLSKDEIQKGLEIYRREWEQFCQWIVKTFKEEAEALPSVY